MTLTAVQLYRMVANGNITDLRKNLMYMNKKRLMSFHIVKLGKSPTVDYYEKIKILAENNWIFTRAGVRYIIARFDINLGVKMLQLYYKHMHSISLYRGRRLIDYSDLWSCKATYVRAMLERGLSPVRDIRWDLVDYKHIKQFQTYKKQIIKYYTGGPMHGWIGDNRMHNFAILGIIAVGSIVRDKTDALILSKYCPSKWFILIDPVRYSTDVRIERYINFINIGWLVDITRVWDKCDMHVIKCWERFNPLVKAMINNNITFILEHIIESIKEEYETRINIGYDYQLWVTMLDVVNEASNRIETDKVLNAEKYNEWDKWQC